MARFFVLLSACIIYQNASCLLHQSTWTKLSHYEYLEFKVILTSVFSKFGPRTLSKADHMVGALGSRAIAPRRVPDEGEPTTTGQTVGSAPTSKPTPPPAIGDGVAGVSWTCDVTSARKSFISSGY